MLPKKNRLGRRALEEIFKKGRFLPAPNLTLKFILKPGINQPKVSFVVPKSLIKQASKRNHLRRRGYRVFKENINQYPQGFNGVFIFKQNEDNLSILQNDIKSFISKIY